MGGRYMQRSAFGWILHPSQASRILPQMFLRRILQRYEPDTCRGTDLACWPTSNDRGGQMRFAELYPPTPKGPSKHGLDSRRSRRDYYCLTRG